MRNVLFLMIFCMTSAAFAQDEPNSNQAPQDAASAVASDGDKGIKCRHEKKLGSNFLVRVCTTEAQRLLARELAQRDLDNQQGRRQRIR